MTHQISTKIMANREYENLDNAGKLGLIRKFHVTHWPEYPGIYFCLERDCMQKVLETAQERR